MKKYIRIAGTIIIALAFIFILLFSLIKVGDPNDNISRDIIGFKVPTPPMWTSFIPYLGFILAIVIEFFSLHGLVGIVAFMVLFLIGTKLMDIGKPNNNQML